VFLASSVPTDESGVQDVALVTNGGEVVEVVVEYVLIEVVCDEVDAPLYRLPTVSAGVWAGADGVVQHDTMGGHLTPSVGERVPDETLHLVAATALPSASTRTFSGGVAVLPVATVVRAAEPLGDGGLGAVFNRTGHPIMIAESKEPVVETTGSALAPQH